MLIIVLLYLVYKKIIKMTEKNSREDHKHTSFDTVVDDDTII